MVASDYKSMRARVSALIQRRGRNAILRRTTVVGPPFSQTTSSTDHQIRVIVADYADDDVDGTAIRAGDKKLLVSASGMTVEPDATLDTIVVGGEQYGIVNSKQINPGGTAIYYEIQVRR